VSSLILDYIVLYCIFLRDCAADAFD